MKFDTQDLKILEKALDKLSEGFENLPEAAPAVDRERLEAVLLEVAERLQDNYPYFHPLYAGQMLKPPHPVAQLAYMLAMWINPNNHALDGGRASSRMEKEAVAEIAAIFGWHRHLGHLTGGGTLANLEALWVAGRLKPRMKVVASEQAHYTHQRISEVLGLAFETVACDDDARMDPGALAEILEKGRVGTVVATVGATGTGALDPLPEILALREKYGFRLHADAAYGGYFRLADNLDPPAQAVFECIGEADSIVVDPHKHGLQPYGCGCILFRDPGVGRFYQHDSPYTYFTSSELHLGEISLECSRAGASAVALWATQRLLPMVPDGEFAAGLSRGRAAALDLYERIQADKRFRAILKPELDIVVWAPAGGSAGEISERSAALFAAAARENLHLATFRYPAGRLLARWPDVRLNQPYVTCLRACLMKPEHHDWLGRIWEILERAAAAVR
jgi:glutamate/tyrosine decarboxylase-like PLP-dependent enzyme